MTEELQQQLSAMKLRLYSTGFTVGFVVGCTFVVGMIVLIISGM